MNIKEIAKTHLGFNTLDALNIDSEDFKEVSKAQVKDALQAVLAPFKARLELLRCMKDKLHSEDLQTLPHGAKRQLYSLGYDKARDEEITFLEKVIGEAEKL